MSGRRGTVGWTLVALAVAACADSEGREAEARAGFEALLRALDDKDAAALWAIADDETHALFDGLAAEMDDALARIDRCYPDGLKEQARRAVGGGYLFRGARGEDLFRALLDPAALQGPANPASRTVLRVTVESREVSVITATYDSVRFTRDRDGRYRTDLLMQAFLREPALSSLRKNLEEVRRVCPGPAEHHGGTP